MKHTLINAAPAATEGEAFSGCGHGPIPAARRGPNATPVFVNGVSIPETAIASEAQNHRAPSGAEARAAAARALVIRELLLQRAGELGLEPAPERDEKGREETPDEALIRQVLEREAPAAEPTTEECRRVYDVSLARFTSPEVFEASHILFAPEQPGAAAWVAAHGRAVEAIMALRDGADFAEFAAEFSACPTGQEGGALGQLRGGDLAPEFEEALLQLQPGGIGGVPVRTRYGWHVIRLDRRTPARTLPFEAVEHLIRASLRSRAQVAASTRYISRLAAEAEIEGLDLTLGAVA